MKYLIRLPVYLLGGYAIGRLCAQTGHSIALALFLGILLALCLNEFFSHLDNRG